MHWARISLQCPRRLSELVADLLSVAAGVPAAVEAAPSADTVSVYVPAERADRSQAAVQAAIADLGPLLAADGAPAVEVALVDEEDWAEGWKQHFTPLRVGERLVIKPTWAPWPPAEAPAAARPDDVVIELDPGMAFGTGTHPTTRLCLEALEGALGRGDLVVDVGCGSGILSIAAARLGAARVLAVDHDPLAVRVCRDNVLANAVQGVVQVVVGDRLSCLRLEPDLVVANILLQPVLALAGEAAQALRPGGRYLCSGVIDTDEPVLTAGIQEMGLQPAGTRSAEGWLCQTWRRTPDA